MTKAATPTCYRHSVRDPQFADLVLDHAATVAREQDFAQDTSTFILAHGSRWNSASREATGQVARTIEHRAVFRSVGIALLEERPFLDEAMATAIGRRSDTTGNASPRTQISKR
jgi:hypothetical protein